MILHHHHRTHTHRTCYFYLPPLRTCLTTTTAHCTTTHYFFLLLLRARRLAPAAPSLPNNTAGFLRAALRAFTNLRHICAFACIAHPLLPPNAAFGFCRACSSFTWLGSLPRTAALPYLRTHVRMDFCLRRASRGRFFGLPARAARALRAHALRRASLAARAHSYIHLFLFLLFLFHAFLILILYSALLHIPPHNNMFLFFFSFSSGSLTMTSVLFLFGLVQQPHPLTGSLTAALPHASFSACSQQLSQQHLPATASPFLPFRLSLKAHSLLVLFLACLLSCFTRLAARFALLLCSMVWCRALALRSSFWLFRGGWDRMDQLDGWMVRIRARAHRAAARAALGFCARAPQRRKWRKCTLLVFAARGGKTRCGVTHTAFARAHAHLLRKTNAHATTARLRAFCARAAALAARCCLPAATAVTRAVRNLPTPLYLTFPSLFTFATYPHLLYIPAHLPTTLSLLTLPRSHAFTTAYWRAGAALASYAAARSCLPRWAKRLCCLA